MGILVVKPGLLTTVQDLGRKGYGRFGISQNGVMDVPSAKIANWLLGNHESEAVLEVTLLGPELEFQSAGTISVTCESALGTANTMGRIPTAYFDVSLNGKAIALWTAHRVSKGDRLSIGTSKRGARCYVAFGGGLDLNQVMNSYATHLKAGFGGFEGRALKAGDVLPVKSKSLDKYIGNCYHEGRMQSEMVESELDRQNSSNMQKATDKQKPAVTVCVVMGPHESRFEPSSLQTFLETIYELTPQSDRMGYRLAAAEVDHTSGINSGNPAPVNGRPFTATKLQHLSGADILSEPNQIGSIQVPGDGQPLIILQDGGTTGGYTKIATIATVDLPKLAQLKPGDRIQFKALSIEEAQSHLSHSTRNLEILKSELLDYVRPVGKELLLTVDGKKYNVFVEEV